MGGISVSLAKSSAFLLLFFLSFICLRPCIISGVCSIVWFCFLSGIHYSFAMQKRLVIWTGLGWAGFNCVRANGCYTLFVSFFFLFFLVVFEDGSRWCVYGMGWMDVNGCGGGDEHVFQVLQVHFNAVEILQRKRITCLHMWYLIRVAYLLVSILTSTHSHTKEASPPTLSIPP
jgi:hypothetical protein